MGTSAKQASSQPKSYESALAELEALVARLESGELPLDKLLTEYQRGAELLKFCRERLEAVDQQFKILDQGVIKPFPAA